jgi:hypothetical protein
LAHEFFLKYALFIAGGIPQRFGPDSEKFADPALRTAEKNADPEKNAGASLRRTINS